MLFTSPIRPSPRIESCETAEGVTGAQQSRGDHAPKFDASPLASRDLDVGTSFLCSAWGDSADG